MKFKSTAIVLIMLFFAAGNSVAVLPQLGSTAYNPAHLLGHPAQASVAWRTQTIAAKSAASWQAFEYPATGAVSLAIGTPIPLTSKSATDAELAAAGAAFVSDNAERLGIGGCEPGTGLVRRVGRLISVQFRPEIGGVQIYGSFIALTVNSSGGLMTVKAEGFGDEVTGGFSITEAEAVAAAESATGLTGVTCEVHKWLLPHSDGGAIVLLPCYLVTFVPEDPSFRPAVFVDARDGGVIQIENRVVYDRLAGTIEGLYKPHYARDDDARAPFPDEGTSISGGGSTRTNGDGEFAFNVDQLPVTLTTQLKGRWVNVQYDDGDDASIQTRISTFDPITLVWDNNHSRDDERNLYYHVNLVHGYYKALDSNFKGMDWAVPAVCQYGDHYDNAFWNGVGLYFGGGGQMGNFAMYADVIYHEYSHGVTGYIYSAGDLPYSGESGAMNEGWSDYFACTITDEPLEGEGGLTGGYLRNLDNKLVYPRDLDGEVHDDSRIISGAMWHTRQQLGAEYSDSLLHFARYLLGNNFLDYFTDVLATDDDDGDITNGTPNAETLYAQFGRHGIGPGTYPKIAITHADLTDNADNEVSGDGDRLWEPGETIAIGLEVERYGELYPPPARDVFVKLTTDSPDIRIVRDQVACGDMRVGDVASGGQRLLFHIGEFAPLEFVSLFLTVSRDVGDTLFQDTIRLPIGHPPVLLVRDGSKESNDYTPYFAGALDSLNTVYEQFSTATPVMPLADRLAQYPSVIWYTGDDQDNILSMRSQLTLAEFIDGGGKVLLTGQSVENAPSAGDLLENYFGAAIVDDSVKGLQLLGVTGDPVSDGMNLLLIGWRGAQNQKRATTMQAVGNGTEILHWNRMADNPAGGVRWEDTFTGARTVYFGFGLESVSGQGPTSDRAETLAPILNWFGVANGVSKEPPAPPLRFALEPAFPNPFNQLSIVNYQLSIGGSASLRLYDMNGRLVTTLLNQWQAAGKHRALIDGGSLPNGLYLIRLDAGGESAERKAVLIK